MGKRQSRLRPEEVEELVKATHFTPKELNRWYRGFLRDCPSGSLTEQEFCRIYGQFFPFGDSEQLASLVFRGFGAGEKGVVGFQQFITALSTATRGSMEERITLLFRLYDCDGDGRVSREDVEKVVEAMYGMVGPLLAQERGEGEEEGTDTGRETENKAEDVSAMVSARVKEIFQTLDKTEEKRVSVGQFMEAVRGDAAMTGALQHHQQLLL